MTTSGDELHNEVAGHWAEFDGGAVGMGFENETGIAFASGAPGESGAHIPTPLVDWASRNVVVARSRLFSSF